MEDGAVKKGTKKTITLPKDKHAPKKPITAYNLYAADQRVKMKKENAERSFGDMNREIGSLWTTLTAEEKQPYLEQAEQNRVKYVKEVEEYQKSDKYKQYLQTVAALQQRQQQKKVEKEHSKQKKKITKQQKDDHSATSQTASPAVLPPALPPPSKPPPVSLKRSFVSGTEIPIFTDQFLLHNREMEGRVRKLRQTTSDQEEENALLSRHVDNMGTQTQRLETDIQTQKLRNQVLRQRLGFLKESLADAFGGVAIPGIDSVPSVDTIAEYLKEVESVVVAKQPGDDDKHSKVVSTVRKVARELVERVRERETTQEERMDSS